MDKNMIRIDDLIKQRLAGGEEQERPGAWLRMKDLLDNEMPERRPAAFPWRRMMSYTAAILALSAIGIGSYEALSGLRGNKGHHIASASHGNTAAPAQNAAANSVAYGSSSNSKGNILTGSNKEKYNTNPAANGNENTAPKNKTAKKSSIKAADKQAANTLSASVDHAKNASVNNKDNKLVNNNLNNNKSSKNINNTAAAGKQNKSLATNTKPASTIVPSAGNTGTAGKAGNWKHKHGKGAGPDKNAGAIAANQPTVNKPAAPDSIPSISVSQTMTVDPRTNTASFKQSLTGIGKAPDPRPANSIPSAENNYNNPRYVASAANGGYEAVEVASSKVIAPAAAVEAPAAKTEANKELGLSSNSKNSHRSHQGWDFSGINQFLRDVKYNLGQVKYSTGITGGFNMVFLDGKALPGFQLGGTQTLGISDRISLLFELRYVHNFNKSYTLQDNYTRYTQEIDNSWSKDSMEHYFKFTALQQISLPVMLQYNINDKMRLFGGASVAYIVGLAPDFADNAIPGYRSTGIATPSQEQINAQNARINLNSFSSRWGLGGLFGVSYQLTPKLTVDGRYTQNFWTDAKTPGAKIVSDRLYRKPGVQFSISYDLSKGSKKN